MSTYFILLFIHSIIRYIILALLIVTIVKSFIGWKKQSSYTSLDNRISSFTVIASHIQLLTGLILYWISPLLQYIRKEETQWMSNTLFRYWNIEHLFGMLLAIVLITIGRIVSKKTSRDELKHKKIFIYFLIALIIILIMIPWPFRAVIGRAWI